MARPFALYDAFTKSPFGGSQAAIVSDASDISRDRRIAIAKELGYPATCFVDGVDDGVVTAQFFSTVMEQPMCGHGTVCLMTWAVETNAVTAPNFGPQKITLRLPRGDADVLLSNGSNGRTLTMLHVTPPRFRTDKIDLSRLACLFGITEKDIDSHVPIETAVADFTHLIVPVVGLDAARRISPDFAGIIAYCHELGIDTFTAISTETDRANADVHVRDFCPAVGVSESAAAGTTNAAVSSYLVRHQLVGADDQGAVEVTAEQGLELGRASEISTRITVRESGETEIMVGGYATKIADGNLAV